MLAVTRRTVLEVAAASLLVPLSSWLGLARLDWNDKGWDRFVDVWSASLFADCVFTLGSLVAFIVALRLAHRTGPLLGAIASAVLNTAVYFLSFLSIPEVDSTTGEALEIVVDHGVYGLVFCALAVPVVSFAVGRVANDADGPGTGTVARERAPPG